MVKTSGGEIVQYALSVVFRYLEEHGYNNHIYCKSEQIGCSALFKGDDG